DRASNRGTAAILNFVAYATKFGNGSRRPIMRISRRDGRRGDLRNAESFAVNGTLGGRGAGATSLVPKRVNGIEERGFPGRIIAEENPDCGAEEERDQDGFGRNEGGPVRARRNGLWRS